MAEKYFLWRFEEYEWCGRTEYKKSIYVENITYETAVDFCSKNPELRFEQMSKLDDTFENRR